jgi:hypothetical protein
LAIEYKGSQVGLKGQVIMSRLDISRKYLTFRVCSRRFTHCCGFVYIYKKEKKRKKERKKERKSIQSLFMWITCYFLNCGGIGARSSDFVNFKTKFANY